MEFELTITQDVLRMMLFCMAICIIGLHFMRLLQKHDWHFTAYISYLDGKFQWVPLIFVFVPAACFLLDYTILGIYTDIVYLGAVSLLYLPRKKSGIGDIIWDRRAKHVLVISYLISAGVIAPAFAVPFEWARVLIPSIVLVIMPLTVPLAAVIELPSERTQESRSMSEVQHFIHDRYKKRGFVVVGVPAGDECAKTKKILVEALSPLGEVVVSEDGCSDIKDVVKLCSENMNDKSAALVCENVTGLKRLADGAYQLFDEFADDTDDPGAILYGRVDGDRYRAEIEGFTDGGADFTFIPPRGYAEKFHTKLATERDLELLAGALSVAHRAGVNMEQLRNISKEVQE